MGAKGVLENNVIKETEPTAPEPSFNNLNNVSKNQPHAPQLPKVTAEQNNSPTTKSKYFPNSSDQANEQKINSSTPQNVIPSESIIPKQPRYHVAPPRKEFDAREYKFSCDQCDWKCNLRHHMTTHVSDVHENKGQFICEHCQGMFRSRKNLTTHERRTHAQ